MQMENFPLKWVALIGLSLLTFTAFLDFTIVTTALPFIQKDLHADILKLQWVMNIFAMGVAMFMIAAGQAGDVYGRKKVFFIGFILFAIAAVGGALSPTIEWLIFFRGIQGFAGAIIFTLGVTLLPLTFPLDRQTEAVGIFSAINAFGLAIGPFLGGILISYFSWRAVFWVNIPIMIVGAILFISAAKPEPKSTLTITFDWRGLILLVSGLGTFIYGLVYGEQYGWQFALSWGTLIYGIAALGLLLYVENHIEHPLLDFSLFKNNYALLCILVCITSGFITFVFMFFDPLYLQLIRNQGPFLVGLTLLSVPVIQVIISLGLKQLLNRFSVISLLLLGIGTAFISAMLHSLVQPDSSIILIIIMLMLMGYVWGIANAGTITLITKSVPPEKMGNSIGTIFTFWNIAGSVLITLSSILFHWRENAKFNEILLDKNITLDAAQHQQVSVMLADPEQAKTILSQFVGPEHAELLSAFQNSFMHGFHWVAIASALIIIAIYLVGLKLR